MIIIDFFFLFIYWLKKVYSTLCKMEFMI